MAGGEIDGAAKRIFALTQAAIDPLEGARYQLNSAAPAEAFLQSIITALWKFCFEIFVSVSAC
jgi:hypothetical protein